MFWHKFDLFCRKKRVQQKQTCCFFFLCFFQIRPIIERPIMLFSTEFWIKINKIIDQLPSKASVSSMSQRWWTQPADLWAYEARVGSISKYQTVGDSAQITPSPANRRPEPPGRPVCSVLKILSTDFGNFGWALSQRGWAGQGRHLPWQPFWILVWREVKWNMKKPEFFETKIKYV